ncbi:ABC transporter ATP-binding protein [Alkalicella caledoniensis]|uniref:ABC transporter ATP-binding protein n=1 Tax=Alkalicella caledoniensis TaxID=2731377 RepID=A0A7G9W832_ALKCA|nr:ABC transporter ATP-binding protein [Alkalicella caledoniensis]QNO14844.1 ABC transporter ATP-binding protein [Alkalicella caledoniensis]
MTHKIIEIKDLIKEFPNGRRAIDGLNLSVNKGEIFGLIGPNGAGKTTTIKILLGLMEPTKGEALIFNQKIPTNRQKLLQKIGYVSESSTLYPNMTVEEILKFTQGFYPQWDKSLEERYLEMFSLRKKDRVKNLSKGMKNQLSLIAALSYKPDLLILDEPTSGLDPIWRQDFLQAIIGEIANWGNTVFFSSHILSEVERIADTVAIIKSGKIALQRQMDDIKLNEKVIRVVFQREINEEKLLFKGVREISRQGKGYIIKVAENFDEVYRAITEIPHFTVEILERNLEDIFMEYAKKEVKKDV